MALSGEYGTRVVAPSLLDIDVSRALDHTTPLSHQHSIFAVRSGYRTAFNELGYPLAANLQMR